MLKGTKGGPEGNGLKGRIRKEELERNYHNETVRNTNFKCNFRNADYSTDNRKEIQI